MAGDTEEGRYPEFLNASARMSRVLGAADEVSLGVAVATALEDLARWTKADCAFVTLVDEAGMVTDDWHWVAPGFDPVAPAIGAPLTDTFGSAMEFLKIGHTVVVEDLAGIELSPAERATANRNDLRALLLVPVRVGGVFLGGAGLHMYGRPRAWEPDIVGPVELIAAMLVQALIRIHHRGAVEQANVRARRIAGFVPSPLIMLDGFGRVTWVSPSYSTTTGRRPEEVLGQAVATLFVPEDGALVAELATARRLSARLLDADGTWRWTELSWQAFDDEDAGGGLDDQAVLELRDIHDRQVQADELRRNADHDPLTGLLNRSGLERRLITLAGERRTILTAFCDLNRFKRWNDTHGHDAGDDLLRNVSAVLLAAVRPTDLVARVGGDELWSSWWTRRGRTDVGSSNVWNRLPPVSPAPATTG